MTTNLQHSISLLAELTHKTSPVNPSIIYQGHNYLKPVGGFLQKVDYSSMDRVLGSHSFDSIRQTILMHEGIFKQQVQELHRLYKVQTQIMQELKRSTRQSNETDTKRERGNSFQGFSSVRDDPRELSNSCSGESLRIPIMFDLEKPAEATTCSTVHLHADDVEVELTLSLGHCSKDHQCNSSQKPDDHDLDYHQSKNFGCSSSRKRDRDEEFIEPSSIKSSNNGDLYRENTRPRWLFQDLSSNRT